MLERLFNEFSQGRKPDKDDFRNSFLFSILEDPFWIWCKYHAPPQSAKYVADRYDKAKAQKEKAERECFINSKYPGAVFIEGDHSPETFQNTLKAMIDGAPAVSAPLLWDLPNKLCARANLIIREAGGKSVFGNYYYSVMQLKTAGEVKDHYALAGALANKILARIQNFEPPVFRISLRDGKKELTPRNFYGKLDNAVELWRKIKSGDFMPETNRPPRACAPPWQEYANNLARERKDLIMLPDIGPDVRQALRNEGYTDTDKIALSSPAKLAEFLDAETVPVFNIYANACAYYFDQMIQKQKGLFPIKKSERNLYFDFETSGQISAENPAHVYLIGLWDREKGKYVSFLADGAKDEEKIFREFLDYLGDGENCALYHWTAYETNQMRAIAAKYPALKEKLEKTIKQCVDLKDIIKKSFYLPCPGFSLKTVAPYFGFAWRQEDCGAMDSMALYWQWLKDKNEEHIKKALDYNEDDCVAMLYTQEKLERCEVHTINKM